jgi:uncharacterized protein (TIGR01777 family)
MDIAITGSSGFIGQALCSYLALGGHRIRRVLRAGSSQAALPGALVWDPNDPQALGRGLLGCDAVIHLAGAGISDHRWTASYKRQILSSRVEGTQSICQALAGMGRKPRILVSASAIGIYGPRGGEPLDEGAGPGGDFLAKVCLNWEQSAEAARRAGIRVVHPRFGLVLGREGGALKKMLLPFQLGLGGVMGNGAQVYSWITLQDLCHAILFLLESQDAEGAFNLTAPGACSNREYTVALGKALKRPTRLPMPAFAARLAFGEMAEALLLSGQNAKPARLLQLNFRFSAATIDEAFQQIFNSKVNP